MGYGRPMNSPRGSRVSIRPLGGGAGCAGMILFSIIASLLLTFVVNVVR